MADFKASYGEMEAMSGKLENGREEIGDILRRLKSDVDRLLGDDFKTQHASGKFGEGYTELTTGLEKAIEGISDMGESLRKMQQAIKDTDQALAGN
ncbi:WXG100 family type VII secretion target [Microbacterium sp. SSM24]|uniref:WXG100 family type VII secretion target n=1 Tax=Microbacterium sp. SSM24 TaxID=2991714 RepID=UPI0022264985|nr:WXG100 family type VII secretion target [Microbacterium sp. SSM24]MCW3492373.1 WXG100 family type VII secretion target [Microbacterium sp. SSM24]MCW3493217.1 WXG100 family type VII secretion target [Microbacterium sp. SSM24]